MRHEIQVRLKRHYGKPGHLLGTIKRVVKTEQIGNFNPAFCVYHYKTYLVHSMAGDLSDPFRRKKEYLGSLYIEI